MYTGNVLFQLFLAELLPGYMQEGLPVPSLNYKTLIYKCNALNALYVTLITAAGLHWSGTFRLTEIIDNYGHLMTVSMIYGFTVSLVTYLYAVLTNTQIRISGNVIYDYFMGACLNPRIGSIDLKMWGEVRIPWVIVFFLAVSGGCKQYEQYGYVTPVSPRLSTVTTPFITRNVAEYGLHDPCHRPLSQRLVRYRALLWLFSLIRSPTSGKGEECIPQTWDMYHEK